MTGEHMIIRLPKEKIIKETDTYILADLGDAENLIQLCLAALSNPGIGVMEKKGKEDE